MATTLCRYQGQNIYFNLPEPSGTENGKLSESNLSEGEQGTLSLENDTSAHAETQYKETVARLTNYFAPKQNKSYERHLFRKMVQRDDNIKDQITSSCKSNSLRRKGLERGDQSLDTVTTLARVLESVTNQQKSFTNNAKSSKLNGGEE